MKEFHVRLFQIAEKYFADLVTPPPDVDGFAPPASANPVPLILPTPLPDGRTLPDLQNFLLTARNNAALAQAGYYLYRFLFQTPDGPNPIYTNWLAAYRESRLGDGLRLVLHLDDDGLICLPWELLADENGNYLAALSSARPHTIVRMRWKAGDLSMPPVPMTGDAIRALLVVAHAPEDDYKILGPEEALQVDAAVFRLLPWKLDLRVLIRPSLLHLQQWCRTWQPHIFHFAGHGEFDDNTAYLRFYDPTQPTEVRLDPPTLASYFSAGLPRLVVLNACRTGQSGEVQRATSNLTKTLVEAGAVAVVAMQADVDGQLAPSLMHSFYRTLASGAAVDVALTEARRAVREANPQGRDWALPALYLAHGTPAENVLQLNNQTLESKVLQPEPDVPDRYRRHIQDLQLRLRIGVGREQEKLTLERALLDGDAETAVTLLYGELAMGKTNLLYWLSERCARRDIPFIYADFGQATLSYWDALRLLRDGQVTARATGIRLVNRLNPNVAFNLFNHMLNTKLIRGYADEHPQPPAPGEPVPDLTIDKNVATELERLGTLLSGENPYESITEAFWDCLERLAQPHGMLLFLDHVDRLFSGEVNKLQNYIISRVVNAGRYPKARKVRLALAVEAPTTGVDDYNERPWDFLLDEPNVEVQNVRGFEPGNLFWLGRLWARRYFVSHRPAFVGDKQFTPQQLDSYVASLLNENYRRRPQRPGRLVTDLVNRENLTDWLENL